MKSRNFFLSFVLPAMAAVLFSGCSDMAKKVAMKAVDSVEFEKTDTAKWGPVVEQEIDLPAFAAIDAKGAVQIVFTQDTVCSVRVRGNEKCLAAYKFSVRNAELNIDPENFSGKVNKRTPSVTLFVSAPSLSEIEMSGACRLEMPEPVTQAEALSVELEGAGEISIADLTLASLDIEVSGAGRCDLAKVTATGDIELEVNGAGDIAANVFCQDLNVEINGAGNAVLSGECKGTFSCEQNGAGKIDNSNLKR